MNPISVKEKVETDRIARPSQAGAGIVPAEREAEMLARVGEKNSRLYNLVTSGYRRRQAGAGEFNSLKELDRERSRIARELHAGAGQPPGGPSTLNLEMLDDCSQSLPQPAREALQRLRALAEQALAQVRAVSHRLHPPEWQRLSIEEALYAQPCGIEWSREPHR